MTITVPDWSMLYSARDEPLELYHLPSDPRQQRNVAEENPGTVREMHGRYVELLKELKGCAASVRTAVGAIASAPATSSASG